MRVRASDGEDILSPHLAGCPRLYSPFREPQTLAGRTTQACLDLAIT